MEPGPTLQQRCAKIELLLMDVDGVLTDGRIIYGDNGVETKAFHVRDGSGLTLWRRAGKRAGIITGRTSPVVGRRVAELGLDVVIQGMDDKLSALQTILQDQKLRPDQVAFVGDDLLDLPVLLNCGLALTVADASPEVIMRSHYVTRAAGGQGAIREIVELLLHAQGLWTGMMEGFVGRISNPAERDGLEIRPTA